MAKIHLESGPFGKSACGKQNVDTTRLVDEVTCKTCRYTKRFIEKLRQL